MNAPHASQAHPHARLRILIVDDHPMIRSGLAAMVRGEADFELVGEAAHGADAVRIAPELMPDVVLIDLVMPQMDGIAVADAIIRLPLQHAPQRVICSASSDQNLVVAAQAVDLFLHASPPQGMVQI